MKIFEIDSMHYTRRYEEAEIVALYLFSQLSPEEKCRALYDDDAPRIEIHAAELHLDSLTKDDLSAGGVRSITEIDNASPLDLKLIILHADESVLEVNDEIYDEVPRIRKYRRDDMYDAVRRLPLDIVKKLGVVGTHEYNLADDSYYCVLPEVGIRVACNMAGIPQGAWKAVTNREIPLQDESYVHTRSGVWLPFNEAISRMDSALLDEIPKRPETDQSLIDRYEALHEKRFGKPWIPKEATTDV